jgi:hypothetical protein
MRRVEEGCFQNQLSRELSGYVLLHVHVVVWLPSDWGHLTWDLR